MIMGMGAAYIAQPLFSSCKSNSEVYSNARLLAAAPEMERELVLLREVVEAARRCLAQGAIVAEFVHLFQRTEREYREAFPETEKPDA